MQPCALLVEEDDDIWEFVTLVLESESYNVYQAKNGVAGIAALQQIDSEA